MHKALRKLPSLDFLRGFEAAGRLLSFTRAADELFLTQSALSRQIRAIEDALGVELFERRHRSLALTARGAAFHREVAQALASLAQAATHAVADAREPGFTLTTSVSFASLWVIPRLARFRARHPEVEVYVSADDRVVDLDRGDVDVAVRYLAEESAPPDSVQLFGERMLPVASPALARDSSAPLRRPRDLARHVLLHFDDPEGRLPWLNWSSWLASNGLPELKPAGALRFSLYDQLIQAAVAGQGVALGRMPLLEAHLADGRLVAPFPRRYASRRGYYVMVAPHARIRSDVKAFVDWLVEEAAVARRQVRGAAGSGARSAGSRRQTARYNRAHSA